MSLDPEQAENIPRKLIGMYSDTELHLLGMMADAVTKGIDTPEWAAQQPAEMLRFRNQAQRLANGLTAAAPTVVGEAVSKAVTFGKEAVEADVNLAGHLAAKSGKAAGLQANLTIGDTLTNRAVADGVGTLATVNQALPGAASKLYQQVTARVNATPVSSDLTRRQAVQQALDVLTARGITGFRDNAGRNWSLSTYVEMKSRTLVNNTLREAHVQEALARGHDLLVVSSHPRPAPQCQPYEGQVLSIGPQASDADTVRPNATGGRAVKVTVKATLDDARKNGLFHPNCKHATSIFIPGASRTFTTDPDPEGYKATQQLRQMERAIRDTKRRQAVAIDPAVKKRLGATLRSQQSTLKAHVDANDLKRRALRERPDLGYRINPPDALDSVVDVPTPKPGPDLGEYLAAEQKYKTDVADWLNAETAHNTKLWLDAEQKFHAEIAAARSATKAAKADPPAIITEDEGREAGHAIWHDYADQLPADQRDGVIEYTGNGYDDINPGLRGTGGATAGAFNHLGDRARAKMLTHIKAIDDAIENAPRVPEAVRVAREVGREVFGIPYIAFSAPTTAQALANRAAHVASLVGEVKKDDAFMSTALQSKLGYVKDGFVQLLLDVPEGTPGLYVSSHQRINGVNDPKGLAAFGPDENELLLPRGVEYEIYDVDVSMTGVVQNVTLFARIVGIKPDPIKERK